MYKNLFRNRGHSNETFQSISGPELFPHGPGPDHLSFRNRHPPLCPLPLCAGHQRLGHPLRWCFGRRHGPHRAPLPSGRRSGRPHPPAEDHVCTGLHHRHRRLELRPLWPKWLGPPPCRPVAGSLRHLGLLPPLGGLCRTPSGGRVSAHPGQRAGQSGPGPLRSSWPHSGRHAFWPRP